MREELVKIVKIQKWIKRWYLKKNQKAIIVQKYMRGYKEYKKIYRKRILHSISSDISCAFYNAKG